MCSTSVWHTSCLTAHSAGHSAQATRESLQEQTARGSGTAYKVSSHPELSTDCFQTQTASMVPGNGANEAVWAPHSSRCITCVRQSCSRRHISVLWHMSHGIWNIITDNLISLNMENTLCVEQYGSSSLKQEYIETKDGDVVVKKKSAKLTSLSQLFCVSQHNKSCKSTYWVGPVFNSDWNKQWSRASDMHQDQLLNFMKVGRSLNLQLEYTSVNTLYYRPVLPLQSLNQWISWPNWTYWTLFMVIGNCLTRSPIGYCTQLPLDELAPNSCLLLY